MEQHLPVSIDREMDNNSESLLRSLGDLVRWVQASDANAPGRLALLEQARRLLSDEKKADPTEPKFADERSALAAQLEHWRYQHLGHCGGRVAADDRRLVDTLDLAAAALAGYPSREPRWPRAAVEQHAYGREEVARVLECLEPQVPLEDLCRRAAELTREHFSVSARSPKSSGRRMLLYAPLYLSNYCVNHCVYCGFRWPESIERKHLSFDEAIAQADVLLGRGFRHILLVAGEFPSLTTTEYFTAILRALRARGVRPSVEIAPQTTAAYAEMAAAGACGVTLYQETFDEKLYSIYHPRGSKRAYDWRLEALERAAEAGIERLGLGFLLGLADPREDFAAMVRQAVYLRSRFPDCKLAFSLPRIRETPPGFATPYPVDDDMFLRMYSGLRIAFPQSTLVLSTREPPEMRERLARICITQISAGSSTAPGGYDECGTAPLSGQQFPVCDDRSPAQMDQWLRGEGFEVAWEIQ